jgi:hypothetical protein
MLTALFVAGGSALAQEPAPPIGEPVHDVRGRRHPLAPIPWFYREIDRERQNVGTLGRLNATRDEQWNSITGWTRPGTSLDWAR